jgi:hypothetical protein
MVPLVSLPHSQEYAICTSLEPDQSPLAYVVRCVHKIVTWLLASSCLSVHLPARLPTRMEWLGSRWTDFHEISYLRILRNSVKKIHVSLKSEKNNRYFTWRPLYIYDDILLNSSENEICSGQKFRGSEHWFLYKYIFPKKCTFYDIVWKNKVEPDGP